MHSKGFSTKAECPTKEGCLAVLDTGSDLAGRGYKTLHVLFHSIHSSHNSTQSTHTPSGYIIGNEHYNCIRGSVVSCTHMALDKHPERSSLPSTFGFGKGHSNGQDGTEQKTQSSHCTTGDPLELERRSIAAETLPQSPLTRTQQVVSSSLESLKTQDRRNSSEIRETSFEADHEYSKSVTYQRVRKKVKKRRAVSVCAVKIVALLILGVVIAGLFSIPITLFILKANTNNVSHS